MQSKDYQQVVTLMKDVIEACPWNAEFREIRALAYEGLGDLRNAISDLRPTTTLRLDNTAGHLKISALYYRLGDVEQSLSYVAYILFKVGDLRLLNTSTLFSGRYVNASS